MPTYDLWFHEHLGWFAVRLEAGRVTGIHGPIPDATALDCDPTALVYDERPEALQRARETADQYVPLERWTQGGLKHPSRPLVVELIVSVLGDLWSRITRFLRS